MTMPKAAMHKYRNAATRKNYIGSAGQSTSVEPEANPILMENSPNGKLWACVLASHLRHYAAAVFNCHSVHARHLAGAFVGCVIVVRSRGIGKIWPLFDTNTRG